MSGNRKTRELPAGLTLVIWRHFDGTYLGQVQEHHLDEPVYECASRTALGCVRKLMEHATKAGATPKTPPRHA